MKVDEYCSLLAGRLQKYFDVLHGGLYGGKIYNVAASFSIRENQTVLFKENVMDYTESNEICLVSAADTEEALTRELEQLPEIARSAAAPSRHHKSTVVTRVFVTTCADRRMITAVRHFHCIKLFRCGLWGWAECRTVLVDAGSGRVYTNGAAREHRKIFAPA